MFKRPGIKLKEREVLEVIRQTFNNFHHFLPDPLVDDEVIMHFGNGRYSCHVDGACPIRIFTDQDLGTLKAFSLSRLQKINIVDNVRDIAHCYARQGFGWVKTVD